MTAADEFSAAEKALEDRGLRLTRAVHVGRTRRYLVEARDAVTKAEFSAYGIDFPDAIRNLVDVVRKRPRKAMRFPS